MHPLALMNFILGFICMGSVEMLGTRSKRKLQNEYNHLDSIRYYEAESHSQLILAGLVDKASAS